MYFCRKNQKDVEEKELDFHADIFTTTSLNFVCVRFSDFRQVIFFQTQTGYEKEISHVKDKLKEMADRECTAYM